MKIATLLIPVALLGSALAADPSVIARIGDEDVKSTEITPYLDGLTAAQKQQLAANPAALNQLVRTLVVEQLLLKKALAEKWDQRPEVAAQIDRARENVIAESYLSSVSQPPADFPSSKDVSSAYEQLKGSLLLPKQYRLAQIFIAKGDGAADRVAAVRKSLAQAGVEFAAIAKRESEEAGSAAKGGDIGWVSAGQLQPEIRDQVAKLGKGAISEPVELADGWHIVKLLDVKDARTPSLDEVKDGLAARLHDEQAKANRTAVINRLLDENAVAINEIALSQLVQPEKK